jgi:hypothetical protein
VGYNYGLIHTPTSSHCPNLIFDLNLKMSTTNLTTALGAKSGQSFPPPGSDAEKEMFRNLQGHLKHQFETSYPDLRAKKTVVIIPSLTLDEEILAKVAGSVHYEERLLCLLMLLRMPRTHVVYVTSVPVDPCIIDYYLHLLPGITGYHAQQRLTLLSCYDASPRSLSQKILERPRLIERIKKSIAADHHCHIACFNVTELERTLALRLDMPIFGCDPDLLHFGSKSGSRKIFKTAGALMPAGFEDLYSENDLFNALAELKNQNPLLRKAVVKVNDGFSGDGNGIFSYEAAPQNGSMRQWIAGNIHSKLKIVAEGLSYEVFISKFSSMGGIVEAFVEGEEKVSPSVQCRIDPLGNIMVASTHDQLLGGESGQVFLGANFPANKEYAIDIGKIGKDIAEELKKLGVVGRFAVDFISVKENNQWKHYAIEINLRKGGTTHPFLMLQFLTGGNYNAETGLFEIPNNKQPRYYFFSDNLRSDSYKGLTPHDLIDIAMYHGLHYNGSLEEGVMFHLIGALSQHGKLGVVCIGNTPERANMYYQQTVDVLNLECS